MTSAGAVSVAALGRPVAAAARPASIQPLDDRGGDARGLHRQDARRPLRQRPAWTETYFADGRLDYRESAAAGARLLVFPRATSSAPSTIRGQRLNGGCWTAIKASANCYEFYIAGLPSRPTTRPPGTARRLGGARLAPGRALDLRGEAERVTSAARVRRIGQAIALNLLAQTARICRYSGSPFLPSNRVKDRAHVHIPRALHRRQLGQAHRLQDPGRHQPRQQQDHRRAGARLQGRPRQGAGRRRQGLQDLAQGVGLRARQDPAQGRRPAARPRRRDRQGAHPGAGQGPGRGQDGGAERRRHHRLVRRRGPARLRPHHPGPRRRRAQHGDHGADRPGGRLLALELPRHAGRAQDRRVAGGRLLDHHQVPGGDARLADRPRQVLPRRRRAGRA